MKVELQSGDRITIPEGCKATINGKEVVVEKKVLEFKRGDIIASHLGEILLVDTHDHDKHILTSLVNIDESGDLCNCPCKDWKETYNWRMANAEERQELFDRMKEQGLRWNAEEKKVERLIWRAEKGRIYSYIDEFFKVQFTLDERTPIDNKHYKSLNYFGSRDKVKKVSDLIKKVLTKFHEENHY